MAHDNVFDSPLSGPLHIAMEELVVPDFLLDQPMRRRCLRCRDRGFQATQ